MAVQHPLAVDLTPSTFTALGRGEREAANVCNP